MLLDAETRLLKAFVTDKFCLWSLRMHKGITW